MKRLLALLILISLLSLPALAQTPQPEPTAVSTPETQPSEAPETPSPAPEETPVAPVATDTVPVGVVVDLLERQPELLADMTKIAVDQIGYAYERSIVLGVVFTIVGGVVVMGGGYLLYRSVPAEKRPVVARQVGGAVSVGLGRLDEIDVIPGTDIDNELLRTSKRKIDEKLAQWDAEIAATVKAEVQSLYDAEKERKRENERAQRENEALNGNPQNVTPMPPAPQNSIEA